MSVVGQKRPVSTLRENVSCSSNNGLSQQLERNLEAHRKAIETSELANRIEQLESRSANR